MTKTEIIAELARESGIKKEQVEALIEGCFKKITKAALKGENTHVRSFGSFLIVEKKAKVGQHIKNRTPVKIPAYTSIKFKVSKALITKLNKDKADEAGM